VIKKFHNTEITKPGGDTHIIQIRYSDTQEQKMLKQQTAAARQFRAAEFEYGCLQAVRAGIIPPPTPDRNVAAASMANSASMVLTVPGSNAMIPAVPNAAGTLSPIDPTANDFETYLKQSSNGS
jgi:hypothetical protein